LNYSTAFSPLDAVVIPNNSVFYCSGSEELLSEFKFSHNKRISLESFLSAQFYKIIFKRVFVYNVVEHKFQNYKFPKKLTLICP
jgi:hypothetical protein